MKRFLIFLLLALFWTMLVIAQAPTMKVKESFHFESKPYTFITRDPHDFQQWELMKKLNALSAEILAAKAKGEHPQDKIKLVKKLAKQLED